MFLCVHCLKENVACTQNGQCCKGQCTYGRCKKDAAPGAPGTFCDRHDDCKDPPGTCCVRFVQKMYDKFLTFERHGNELVRNSDGTVERRAGVCGIVSSYLWVRDLCHSTLAQSS